MFFKKKSINTSEAEQIAISSLLKLLRENDILEIELLLNGKIVKIGVNSDYDHRKAPEFFDKRYYIGDNEYLSPIEFSHAFTELSPQTRQTVLRIDGVAPKYYHFER